MSETKVTTISAVPKLASKTKVAAYARVSSAKDAMLYSLASQVSHYNELITNHNGWEFAGVYADEGISGTKADRTEFNRMVKDAKEGKIDLIITKSISRFARNSMVLLKTIRELKKYNVNVYFEEQNIYSISPEGEMVLTFLASFAQEEARSVSENMRWRVKKNFEVGKIWSAVILGYKGVNGRFVIVPEEAKIVRRIFDLYLSGMSIHKIVKLLNDENVPTKYGDHFVPTSIRLILKNYNYTGNLLLQKTFKKDYICKKSVKNNGEKPQYLVSDSHEAIIDLESFEKVQEMLKAKTHPKTGTGHFNRYPFTSMIKCEFCGNKYKRTKNHNNIVWKCRTYISYGAEVCHSFGIPEDILIEKTCEALDIGTFDEGLFKSKVNIITSKDKTLTYHFNDGTTKEITWKNKSRKESWTLEMKEQARLRALKQYGKLGE